MPSLTPLGYPGGPYRGQTPQKGKIKFLVIFFDEIFFSFVGSFGTFIQSTTIPKNCVLSLFWSTFGPKETKTEHTLKWPSKFVSQWIFDFIAKINYFGPFLWPIFLKTWNFSIQVWDKLKTLWCDAPFFSLIEKIFKTCQVWGSNPRPKLWSDFVLTAKPIEPPGPTCFECDFIQSYSPLI